MFVGLLTGLVLVVLAACSWASTATPTPTVAHTVRLGASNAGATNAPIYLAQDLGFFATQGINLDEVFFPSASEVIPRSRAATWTPPSSASIQPRSTRSPATLASSSSPTAARSHADSLPT